MKALALGWLTAPAPNPRVMPMMRMMRMTEQVSRSDFVKRCVAKAKSDTYRYKKDMSSPLQKTCELRPICVHIYICTAVGLLH